MNILAIKYYLERKIPKDQAFQRFDLWLFEIFFFEYFSIQSFSFPNMFKKLSKVLQYIYMYDLFVKIIAFLGRIKKKTQFTCKAL